MKESVIYQEIEAQGEEKGIAKGLAQGITQGRDLQARQVALNLLNEGASLDLIVRVTGLSVEQVQQLQKSNP